MIWQDYIPEDIRGLYEIRDYLHAAAILRNEFPTEFGELCIMFRKFRITTQDILDKGGNESNIPKIVSAALRPKKWKSEQLRAEVMVDGKPVSEDTHFIDYVKNRVAFDLEWNSKDQTFDRDLYALRAFFEYRKVSVGVIMTRSNDLDVVFDKLGTYIEDGKEKVVKAKYGASTTHVGKLWPRLEAGRNGGCPVLVFGITSKLLSDWEGHEKNIEPDDRSARQTRRKYLPYDPS